MQEEVAPLFKVSCLSMGVCLSKLDKPFCLLILPVAADDLSVECHIFSQTPYGANFVQVGPDVGRQGEKSRPVRL